MIILIAGASHTGKTALAQRLLEQYKYPYLSIDHLKMGLIRSGHTSLTPMSSDEELTKYLWPIVREMVKTAVENRQNLRNHFSDIKEYAGVIENRMDDECCTMESVIRDNMEIRKQCERYNVNYILIDKEYRIEIEL